MTVRSDARDLDVETASCESCGESVNIFELSGVVCPSCDTRFTGVEKRRKWLILSKTVATVSEPTADDPPADSAAETYADLREQVGNLLSKLSEPNYVVGVKGTATVAALLPLAVLSPVVTALPPTWRIYSKLNRWTAYQMQKASNADAIANVRLKSGREDLRPAKWVDGAEDEKDRSGWKIKGLSARYDPSVHERDTQRYGKADILHLDSDETEVGTWAECTMDNAIQMDRERYLFRDAVVKAVFDVGNGQTNGQARADGGQAQALDEYSYRMSVQKPGIHEETLVPLNSREGYDGQVVSWTQYQSMKEDRSDQETVRDAKNAAWTAAKLDEIEGRDIFKWALLLGAAGAVLLFHAEIGAFIAGLGGGDGSGGAVGDAVSGGLGSLGTAPVTLAAALGVI